MSDTTPDQFPYEDEGVTVYRGRIRASGTAGVDRPLARGEKVAVVYVGEVVGYAIGPFENTTTRTHTFVADQAAVLDPDVVADLVAEAVARQADLDAELDRRLGVEVDGQGELPLSDAERVGLAEPDLDAAERTIRDRHLQAVEDDDGHFVGVAYDATVEVPGEADAVAVLEEQDDEPALASEETPPDALEGIPDLTRAQLDALDVIVSAYPDRRITSGRRTSVTDGTAHTRAVNALEGLELTERSADGDLLPTDRGADVHKRYLELGALT